MREMRDTVGMADVWWRRAFATLVDAEGERNDGRTPVYRNFGKEDLRDLWVLDCICGEQDGGENQC